MIPYTLVIPTINEIGLTYINNSRYNKRFKMEPNNSLHTKRVLSATWNINEKKKLIKYPPLIIFRYKSRES